MSKRLSISFLDDAFGAAATTGGGGGNPIAGSTDTSFSMSADETTLYSQLFKIADTDSKGVVTPQVAYSLFSKSRLGQGVLSEIWQQADSETKGGLNQQGFFKALKMIALAQNGKPAKVAFLGTATPLPTFEGISLEGLTGSNAKPAATSPMSAHHTGASVISANPTGAGATGPAWQVSQEERERFAQAFASCKPINGIVSVHNSEGESARELFLKSTLPVDTLGKIWNLVDTTGAGKLSQNQFALAMFFITRMRQGLIPSLPTSIPPSLFNSIAMGNAGSPSSTSAIVSSPPATSPLFPSTPSMSVASPLSQSYFGTLGKPPGSPALSRRASTRPAALSPVATANTASTSGLTSPLPGEWVIKDEDKLQYDAFFAKIDVANKGHLTGEDAYEFFLKSKLPQTVLAQIWFVCSAMVVMPSTQQDLIRKKHQNRDLADVDKSGRLNKDEFAVAMHLIKVKMTGAPLPETLPKELVPSSSGRGGLLRTPTTFQSGPASSAGSRQPVSSALSNEVDLLGTAPPTPLAEAKPFGSMGSLSGIGTIPRLPPSRDAADLAEREADLANRKNELRLVESQLSALQPSTEELKRRREKVDAEYKSITEQKHNLTLQLSQLRATYEAETQIVTDEEQQLYRERQTLDIGRAEVQQAEQAVAALRQEKQAIEEQLEQGRADVMHLKRQIKEFNDAASSVRGEMDKLRSELLVQMQHVDVQNKLLSSVQGEYAQLRADVQNETERVESAKARILELQQRVKVQQAINEKERERIRMLKAEKEKLEGEAKVLAETAAAGASATEAPNLDVAVATPVGPPPPTPPMSKKPQRGDPIVHSVSSLDRPVLNSGDVASMTKSLDVLNIKPTMGSPVLAATSTPIIGNSSAPAPSIGVGHQRTASVSSRKSVKEELEELMDANIPKSKRPFSAPNASSMPASGSPAKRPSSLRSVSISADEAGPPNGVSEKNGSVIAKQDEGEKSGMPGPEVETIEFAKAFVSGDASAVPLDDAAAFADAFPDSAAAPGVSNSLGDTQKGFDADFSAAFATGDKSLAQDIPAGRVSTSTQRRGLVGVLSDVDLDAEFNGVFETGNGAPSSAGGAVSAAVKNADRFDDQAFTALPVSSNDFGDDAFKFDASFTAPSGQSGSAQSVPPSAMSGFDEFAATSSAAAAFDADFAGAFDPFPPAAGANGSSPAASGLQRGLSEADLNAAFGGFGAVATQSPVQTDVKATVQGFEDVTFDDVFGGQADFGSFATSTSAPAAGSATVERRGSGSGALAAEKAESAMEDDVEEVKQIVGLGFTREQALNALTLNNFDLRLASNYLLDVKP
ncbi:hypothetical protein HK104_001197 [Borealophlyctis nickersoniae]|nr:hypothetical protein HK104_001197 [Borealophlyctis nickersoniae]